jgi:hypothetical protein
MGGTVDAQPSSKRGGGSRGRLGNKLVHRTEPAEEARLEGQAVTEPSCNCDARFCRGYAASPRLL